MPEPQKISHYELQEQLGEGGMGRVFRAVDLVLHRPVALKLLSLRVASDPGFLERFRREARLAAQLNHPNIATIYEFGEEGSDAFLAMELVEGETLAHLLNKGPLPIPEVRRLGRQMASALAAAHARGIVHRDIKPPNLMLTADGDLKVMDFGVSRRIGETQLTMAGSLVGTASIMAPEIIQGLEAGPEADLFSMGCVLYEMLSGGPPFAGEDAMGVLFRIVNHEPPPLTAAREDIPPDLLGLVDGLLEKDPTKRFGPASAVARVLAEEPAPVPAADGTMILGPERTLVMNATGIRPGPATSAGSMVAPPLDAAPPARRVPPWMWLIAGVSAVGLGLLGWALSRDGGDSDAPTETADATSSERAEAMSLNDRGMLIWDRLRQNPATADSAAVAEARKYFLDAIDRDPTLSTPWNNLGDLLVATGQTVEARSLFESAVEQNETFAPFHANLADIYAGEGRLDEAIEHYRAAVRLNPGEPSYPNNLSYFLVQADRPTEALQVAAVAVRAFPDVAPLWKNKGLAHLAMGDADNLGRAEEAFGRAIELVPNYPDALAGLARVAEAQGDAVLARERWDAVRARAQGELRDEAEAALTRLGS